MITGDCYAIHGEVFMFLPVLSSVWWLYVCDIVADMKNTACLYVQDFAVLMNT